MMKLSRPCVFHHPQICFSLPVSTYSKQECTYLQAPSLLTILPCLWLNHTMAQSIIHGPLWYGGLALPDFYLSQGIGQLKLFLGPLWAQDKTSNLIHISLSHLQLEIGLLILALNLNFSKFKGWIEPTWITSIWRFLNFANYTITLANPWLPTLAHINDTFLMMHFLNLQLSTSELSWLNCCCLYCQVITLTDLTSGDGKDSWPPQAKKTNMVDSILPSP